jgi:hypothetical protein
MGTGVKRPTTTEVKNMWIYTSTPHTSSRRSAQLVKHRDNFTFTFTLTVRTSVLLLRATYDYFSSFVFSYSQAAGRMFSRHSGGGKEQTLGQEYAQEILSDQVMCLVAHKNSITDSRATLQLSYPHRNFMNMTKTFGKTTQGLEKNKHSTRDATSRTDVRTQRCGLGYIQATRAAATSKLGHYHLILYFHCFFA